MQKNFVATLSLAILAVSVAVWAKGETTQIQIEGGDLASPIAIIKPAIVGQFSIWNGPGVSTSGPDGVQHSPAYLDPDKPVGRFIDWPKGIAQERPEGLVRYQVTFRISGPDNSESSFRNYKVLYETGPEGNIGYMYLPNFSDPKFRNGLIYHGIEGNWFYSSNSWEKLVRPIIEEARSKT